MHAQISSALCLSPGELFGLPTGRGASVALGIERTFKSILDVEAGAVALLRQCNRCSARARARTAEKEQKRARAVAARFESIHDLLNECVARCGGALTPTAKQRLELQ